MSIRPLRRGSRRRAALALVSGAALALGTAVALTSTADASVSDPTVDKPVTGNATWFDALGSPFGGCGVPQDDLETQNWLALNVYDTPGDYNMYNRPMPEGDPKIGLWNNGRNCGRWIRITIGDRCANGSNDGNPGAGFCHSGGTWTADEYNGATLDFLVADSCGDPNGWCRDDPFHLDLAKASIDRFEKNGKPVGDLLEKAWGNRHINWHFIEAPNYTGDIKIGFTKDSQKWWTRVAITHLPNGIHSLEFWNGSAWVKAPNSSDMGQSFLIEPVVKGTTDYKIRVTDVNDEYIFGGREYSFSLPESCGSQCSANNTFVEYTTSGGSSSPTPSTTTPEPTTTTPSPSTSTSTKTTKTTKTTTKTTKSSTKNTKTTKTTKCTAKKCSSTKKMVTVKKCKTGKNGKQTCRTITKVKAQAAPSGCAVTVTGSSWGSGFADQVQVQAGSQSLRSWTVTLTYPSGRTVTQAIGASPAGNSGTVAVSSGALPAGAVTSFSLLGTSTGGYSVPLATCSAS